MICPNPKNNIRCKGTMNKYTKTGLCISCAHINKVPHNKGKSYEESYGKEKSESLKNDKRGDKNPMMNLITRQRVINSIRGTVSSKKGKTYDELYGSRSNKIKEKLSKSHKNQIPVQTGLSYEEFYGYKKATELKENLRKLYIGKTYEEIHGVDKAVEMKKKLRLLNIEKRSRNGQLHPAYNINSISIIENYGEIHGYNFQHAENGGEFHIKELGYWVDGYDIDENVVIEIDEKQHFKPNGKLKDKDVLRQKEIEKHLGCKFIRIRIND